MNHLFSRVCALSPQVFLGNIKKNQSIILKQMEELEKTGAAAAVFPELCLTGATCGDLFFQPAFQQEALEALHALSQVSGSTLVVIGLPLKVQNCLYNVAAVLQGGRIVGLVPKNALTGDQPRWFSPYEKDINTSLSLLGQQVPFGHRLLFTGEGFSLTVQIGQDLFNPLPASAIDALAGAHVVLNPSAAPYTLQAFKEEKSALGRLSQNSNLAYVRANAGNGESTTNFVFAGQCVIYENGDCLGEKPPFVFDEKPLSADIDVTRLTFKRLKNPFFKSPSPLPYESVPFKQNNLPLKALNRAFVRRPFIAADMNEQAAQVFAIFEQGLKTRLKAAGIQQIVLGVSGGLDSTLALLGAAYTLRGMNLPSNHIHALVMPGFGTTDRTKNNGLTLARLLGCTVKEINIIPAVRQHFKDIDHPENLKDVTYENSQARERTQLLMDYANKVHGLVLGTGNLSESALGFSTYNGDHMSMYNPNACVPKTLIRALVNVAGRLFFTPEVDAVCQDIINTPISPELLPSKDGREPGQKTEEILGAYDLHDFFLYHMMDSGSGYTRLRVLAQKAFEATFSKEEIENALCLFTRRFYTQQFKRSCAPDGPQVVFFSLSPRGGLTLPSDLSPLPFIPQPS